MSLINVSPSPHVHSGQSVRSIMMGVIFALIPAMVLSIWFFGWDAVRINIVAVSSCVFFEWAIQKFLIKGELTVKNGSAVVTGILLAFNVPSSLPSWMIISGSLIAIGIAKMSFGGLGNNPFNPALIGRVFLLISFPVDMTYWPSNRMTLANHPDIVSGATPLGLIKEGLKAGQPISELLKEVPSNINLMVGNIGGSLGEVSAIAIIIGGIYLLYKKIITWHIPFSFITTVFLFTGIIWLINPEKSMNPVFHIFTGGIMLGAFFMATDMVTSPMTHSGMIIFGIGCGILTTLIRLYGAYPEGVSFAILIMNAVTPILNQLTKPKKYGEVKNG